MLHWHEPQIAPQHRQRIRRFGRRQRSSPVGDEPAALWRPFFLLDSYADVLWAINMSLIVQIVLNLVLIFFHPLFFHYLIQTVFNLVSIVALVWIIRIFPVDFTSRLGDWFNTLFRVVLIVALVGTIIGGITNLVKFFRSLFRSEPRGESGEQE